MERISDQKGLFAKFGTRKPPEQNDNIKKKSGGRLKAAKKRQLKRNPSLNPSLKGWSRHETEDDFKFSGHDNDEDIRSENRRMLDASKCEGHVI